MDNPETDVKSLELFTDKQVCELLGVSAVTLWRERKNKKINYRRICGTIRYTRADVETYLERNLQAASA
ncbi:MAG TPA: helix-turn-helix domain-containing protein [Pyrinomonadaceae bacterium]|jgi:excisionase family DNA binding protein|nr:helix-turn-helix domain-containing protein [Pyrinomonadaceae bacterium]